MNTENAVSEKPNARTKLLLAALAVIRTRGYAASTVEDLCKAAGVTKGAFFHHFRSKDDLGVAAARFWTTTTGALFEAAPYHDLADPLDRVLAYLDFRAALLGGRLGEFTCLAGTMLQETYETSPPIAAASYASIATHARSLEADFADVIALYGPADCPTAASLALHTQTVLQGAFILAKGQGDATIVHDALDHLRRYLKLLFAKPREDAT
jgi:TetR/AcrR family transcriptional regulator, transcriptional repressor for nem operon